MTEDLDLSYRAQLKGWRLKFLPHVKCLGEISPTITAAKIQQHRWTAGGVQTARKLLPSILRSSLSPACKTEAVFYLSTLFYQSFILLLIFTWPSQYYIRGTILTLDNTALVVSVIFFSFLGPMIFFLYAHVRLYAKGSRHSHYYLYLMLWGVGMAFNSAKATVEGLVIRSAEFVRTPRAVEHGAPADAGGSVTRKLTRQLYLEVLVTAYALYGLVALVQHDEPIFDPFLLVFSAGSLLVVWASIKEMYAERESEASR